MKKKYLKLIGDRKAKMDRVDALLASGETENRDLNATEQTEYNTLITEVRALDTQIEKLKGELEVRSRQEGLDTEASTLSAAPRPRTLGPVDSSTQGPLSSRELRDLQGYSFVRAFRARLEERSLDGLESEMHKEGEIELRDAGAGRGQGNLIIPQKVLNLSGVHGTFEQRDLTATGGSNGDQGGVLIATQLGSLIDRLRKKLIMSQMGMTTLGGLVGLIDLPKVTDDDAAVEKAENATSAESSATFSKISMSPRRLPVFAEISRQLLVQNSVDVEAWVRSDLAFQIAQVLDQRAIYGSGSGQPYGILNAVGVGAVVGGTDGAAPTWDHIVDLETAIATLDADVGALGYLTNTKVRGKLKRTSIEASTNAEKIWPKGNGNMLNEYRTGVTNVVPSNLTKGASGAVCSALVFGNFNDALMGQWGGLEFLVNPYSRDTEGLIRLNCWTFFDFLIRRVESFAVMKDVLTT